MKRRRMRSLSGSRAPRRTAMRPCVALALTAALTGGCVSSPPMRFYTLTPIAPESPPAASADTIRVRLNRVTVPAELDRIQIVRRIDATRLQIDDQNRWAAPLDEMIRRVLAADLAARLPANAVADTNESTGGERMQTLSVDIQELYADPGCSVALRVTWVLTPPQPVQGKGVPGKKATEDTQVPSSGPCSAADAVPQLMSRALGLLSDRIAAAVATASTVAR
jgi:uncharacterized lipoprotein YmbA